MRFSILPAVALLAASSSALAQMPPPRHYDSSNDGAFHPADDASAIDGPGNGLMIELDAFRLSSSFTTGGTTITSGTGGTIGTVPVTVQPLVLVGYQFDQNALMLGIGVASVGGVGGAGGGISFGVSPTYRRYMSPLRTGKISAFGEGGLTFNITAPNGGPSTWGIGVDVGAGAEWLFTRNFGLFGKALLAYGHGNVPVTSTTNLNVDAIGLEGAVGLTLHL